LKPLGAMLLALHAAAALLEPAGVDRRAVVRVISAAAVASIHGLPVKAAGLPRADVAAKLSRVPLFVITNKEDAPYLTEFDQATGRRGGAFFLDPRDALETFKDVKAFDPNAALSVVPLDSVWFELPRSDKEAAAAPLPKAGTSTDLRLFKIRRIESEATEANTLLESQRAKPLPSSSVPLFYIKSMSLDVDGKRQVPYFFRLEDLKAAVGQMDTSATADDVQVISLEKFVAQLSKETLSPPPLLVAAAPAAAVVERMGLGTSEMGQGTGASRAPPQDPLEELVLTTPFSERRK